jgi:hypothetical protein
LRVLTRVGVVFFEAKVFLITIDVLVAVTTVIMLVTIMGNVLNPCFFEIPLELISLFFCARAVRRTVIRVIPCFVFTISMSSY